MKKPFACLLLAVAAFAVISGCATPGDDFVKRSNKVQKITLRTRGEADQRFSARLNIDGQVRELTGVSPAEFPLEACVMTGTIRKLSGDGTLRFEIIEGGATLGFGALEDPGHSCKFRYHDNGIEVWN
jgi:hypothetical protein